MEFFIAFVIFLLVLLALIALLNVFTFPRLKRGVLSQPCQTVSVLIPARDEARNIGGTLKAWLAQVYPDYEVILLDDQSSDTTCLLAEQAAGGADHFQLLHGKPLPAGWKGKNWACHQLAQAARGDVLVFTDADVRWEPGALAALLNEMSRSQADMLTIWPTQVTQTLSERLVVPLMAFVILGYLPLLAVHHFPWPVFSAAMGQCLAFRREAYLALGGHAAVRAALVEDMAFARKVKTQKMHLRMADGADLIITRMYHNWNEVRDGFAKNILAGHGNSPLFLFASIFFHLSLFVFPWFWLLVKPFQALVLIALGILVRLITASFTRQRLMDAFLLPVSVLLMTVISLRAMQWRFTGGPRWKGRAYEK